MLGLLKRCFPDDYPAWEPTLRELIPTFGAELNADPQAAATSMAETAATLGLSA
jgi:malate dehydrogenase (quinone)